MVPSFRHVVPIARRRLLKSSSQLIRDEVLTWLLDRALGQWCIVPGGWRRPPAVQFERKIDAQVFGIFWS